MVWFGCWVGLVKEKLFNLIPSIIRITRLISIVSNPIQIVVVVVVIVVFVNEKVPQKSVGPKKNLGPKNFGYTNFY